MSLVTPIASSSTGAAETALAQFLLGHSGALLNAAALLGGKPAVQRTAWMLKQFVEVPVLTRLLRAELVELDRLLFLHRVDDPDSVEAGCFAEIDPASPVVEEICVLADEFRSHLISVAESDDRPQAWAAILAA